MSAEVITTLLMQSAVNMRNGLDVQHLDKTAKEQSRNILIVFAVFYWYLTTKSGNNI